MEVQTLIDSYIEDIVARLPRASREDVAMELRSLVAEQLAEVAAGFGRPPDRDIALDVLRRFGRPEEVAVRYQPQAPAIIEPELAPAFVKAVVACIGIQWTLTLPQIWISSLPFTDWLLGWGIGAFWWVGVVLAWFAAGSWVRRRAPADPDTFSRPLARRIFWLPFVNDWRPERVVGAKHEPVAHDAATTRPKVPVALVLASVATIFLIAPSWFLERVVPAGSDVGWAAYDAQFQRSLLVPLLVLMFARLVLAVAITIRTAWAPAVETARLSLWFGFVALLYWVVSRSDIFASQETDTLFKAWLLVYLAVNTIQIGVWLIRRFAQRRKQQSLNQRAAAMVNRVPT